MSYLEHVKRVTEAYSNSLQASIIHLLYIYHRLSTTQIADKLNRSKSTILRHLDTLLKTELVTEEEIHEGRGRYPTKYYSIDREQNSTLQGQKIRETRTQLTNQQFQAYLRSFQSQYILAKEIMEQAIEYIELQILQVEKAGDDIEEIMELLKDNLGAVRFSYLTKSIIWSGEFDIEYQAQKEDINEYLDLKFILPIRRLIETVSSKQWTKEGDIWPYND